MFRENNVVSSRQHFGTNNTFSHLIYRSYLENAKNLCLRTAQAPPPKDEACVSSVVDWDLVCKLRVQCTIISHDGARMQWDEWTLAKHYHHLRIPMLNKVENEEVRRLVDSRGKWEGETLSIPSSLKMLRREWQTFHSVKHIMTWTNTQKAVAPFETGNMKM